MNIQLRFFASIRETVGTGSETVATSAGNLAALRDELIARGGPWAEALGRDRAVRVSLDQTMADEGAALRDGSEVAFFPPVTGG